MYGVAESAVFPTGVGVNRVTGAPNYDYESIPHRRGGEPDKDSPPFRVLKYSPQAWG